MNHENVIVCTVEENQGALFGRHHIVNNIAKGKVVCFLGGDDYLESTAIEIISKAYKNKDTLMTYGNWKTESGRINEVFTYSDEVFKNKSFRRSKWKATALNTFKIDLLKAIPEYLLVDSSGKFYDNCTDLAYSFPALELCKQNQVKVIRESLYIYRSKHSNTTLNRLGSLHKTRIREELKTKSIIHKYYDEI